MDRLNRMPIIAGNWKMNMKREQAAELAKALRELMGDTTACEVVACVPFTDLDCVAAEIKGSNIALGAQNCHWAESGAFTGEIAASMLAEIGVKYVIIGHSERRQYFGETDETVNARVKAALAAGLKVIICVGETLEEREEDLTYEVVGRQLAEALDQIEDAEMANIVIAYVLERISKGWGS